MSSKTFPIKVLPVNSLHPQYFIVLFSQVASDQNTKCSGLQKWFFWLLLFCWLVVFSIPQQEPPHIVSGLLNGVYLVSTANISITSMPSMVRRIPVMLGQLCKFHIAPQYQLGKNLNNLQSSKSNRKPYLCSYKKLKSAVIPS